MIANDVSNSAALGANWRLQLTDPDGSPLNMQDFEVIDFGAISYFEIFQNVKTILATPLFSAALERTLGVDQGIVDRPITEASRVTVAILDALTYWEPRVRVVDINFDADAINGHLIVNLKLQIRNVIYGTDTAYEQTTITPPEILDVSVQGPPGPKGDKGDKGDTGPRGAAWFTGATDPTSSIPALPPPIGAPKAGDMYLNTTSGDVFQLQQAAGNGGTTTLSWRKVMTGK